MTRGRRNVSSFASNSAFSNKMYDILGLYGKPCKKHVHYLCVSTFIASLTALCSEVKDK